MKFKGTRVEHDKVDPDNCDCPVCELNADFYKRLADYNAKKRFVVFAAAGLHDPEVTEDRLNKMHADGYDLVLGMEGTLYMKAVPPGAPTETEVINEIIRRQALAAKPEEFDIDDGGTIVAPGSETIN